MEKYGWKVCTERLNRRYHPKPTRVARMNTSSGTATMGDVQLSHEEIKRYGRHLITPEAGETFQKTPSMLLSIADHATWQLVYRGP